MTDSDSDRQDAPAARRNRDAILAVLSEFLPQAGAALEIAGGTGQHVVAFAGASPDVTWQPSDPDPWARASIAAWTGSAGVGNVQPPADIDVTRADWHAALGQSFDLIVCINLLHIAPWIACEGLMAGAGRLLQPGGHLFIYGCFKRNRRHTAESNEQFDRFLVSQDPEWGVRDLEAVVARAQAQGLSHARTVEMPANNLSVIFRRDRAPPR